MLKIARGPNFGGVLAIALLAYLFLVGMFKLAIFLLSILLIPALAWLAYIKINQIKAKSK